MRLLLLLMQLVACVMSARVVAPARLVWPILALAAPARPSLMQTQLVACAMSAGVAAPARLVWPILAPVAPAMLPTMLTLPLALCGSHLQSLLCQGVPSARGACDIAGRTRAFRWPSPTKHTSSAMAARRVHTPAQRFASGQWA